MAVLEEQRLLHEELERIEDAVAERSFEEPKHARNILARDHQVSKYLDRAQSRAQRLVILSKDSADELENEKRELSSGDQFSSFFDEIARIRDHHHRYPDGQAENLEKAYKQTAEEREKIAEKVDGMFTLEEGFGRFFDFMSLHEQFFNLPRQREARRITYLQYIDHFDDFMAPWCVLKQNEKLSEPYFKYLQALYEYLESFYHKTRPLENSQKVFTSWRSEFDELWKTGAVRGWGDKDQTTATANGVSTPQTREGFWCEACQKEFAKESVFEAHFTGKKHIRAVKDQKTKAESESMENGMARLSGFTNTQEVKKKGLAEMEFMIKKLAAAMSTNREDTKTNVERKQGMTMREREEEHKNLYAEALIETEGQDEGSDGEEDEGGDKIYNPLKLPLGWDGKPIPYWLFKLHGLGVEYSCELCGNYFYRGRRAFDKHFTEPRHVFGLRSLGVTGDVNLFRQITTIKEADALLAKQVKQQKKDKQDKDDIIEMEDSAGNIMPEAIYNDLAAQGLL